MAQPTDEGTTERRASGRRGRSAALAALGAVVALAAVAGLWLAAGTRAGSPAPDELRNAARRRAREREIARMLATRGEVRSAAVILSGDAAGKPAASVTLDLRAGAALSPETASAVAGLVASAAPGLDPHDVIGVDSRDPARTHRLSPDAETAYAGAAVLRLRRDVERSLADKLRALFAGMGIECVAVVSAELDLDRVEEEILKLDPDGRGEVVLREERGETQKIEAAVSRITQKISRSPKGLAKVRASVVLFDRVVQEPAGTWRYDRSVEKKLAAYGVLAARALGLAAADMKPGRPVEVQSLASPWATPQVETPRPVASHGKLWTVQSAALIAATVVAALLVFALVRIARAGPRAGGDDTRAAAAPEEAAGENVMADATEQASGAASRAAERAASVLRRWIASEGA